MQPLNIQGKITGIRYNTTMCKNNFSKYNLNDLEIALMTDATFVLKVAQNQEFVVSWWVSAKRTRSYPYARVYDTLGYSGKKVTVIPIFKDEGSEGDRDFLQWDTISLMSLLGVFVIISYYNVAEKSNKPGNVNGNKITNQRFDSDQIKSEMLRLVSYQSDALHWNLEQISKVKEIGVKAIKAYENISKLTNVRVHDSHLALNKINMLMGDKEAFMKNSRFLAKTAQNRECITMQPKEKVDGSKSKITITNYLKGKYFFTCDESKIAGSDISLVEAKHNCGNGLPALGDIKDGLIKMILFTNLNKVKVNGKEYQVKPVLKLTSNSPGGKENLNESDKKIFSKLNEEAEINHFVIAYNKNE